MFAVIKNEKLIALTPYLAKARIEAEGRHPCAIYQRVEESKVLPAWDADRIYRLRELDGHTVEEAHE